MRILGPSNPNSVLARDTFQSTIVKETLTQSFETPNACTEAEVTIQRTLSDILHYAKITASALTAKTSLGEMTVIEGCNGIGISNEIDPKGSDAISAHGPTSWTKTLHLACGILHFKPSDIPPIPVDFFERNVAVLDRMWDDRSPQWNASSPLILSGDLNGVPTQLPIAVIYWPKLYQKDQTSRWRSSGQTWRNYKVAS